MDKFAALVGRQYHLFDYVGAADAERVVVIMGSGCGVVEETVEKLVAEGQKVGPGQGAALSPLRHRGPAGGAAEVGQEDRRAGPHQGARRQRRAALPGRGHGPGRGAGPSPAAARSSAAATACRRRNSRRRWRRRSSPSWPRPQPKRHFTVGINDDVTHLSLDYDPGSPPRATTSRGPCSSAWAATARSAPTAAR